MKYLIVGLGNIGAEYTSTRHNIGFQVLDQFASIYAAPPFQVDRLAMVTSCKLKGRALWLIKPTTYMNLSGKAVRYWTTSLKIPFENILVITDDVALPFNKLRMRPQGSSAGHNGLKSIEASLETQSYPRLKFGIGDDYSRGKQADYVLSRFTASELKELPWGLQKACDMVATFATSGIAQAMNQHND